MELSKQPVFRDRLFCYLIYPHAVGESMLRDGLRSIPFVRERNAEYRQGFCFSQTKNRKALSAITDFGRVATNTQEGVD